MNILLVFCNTSHVDSGGQYLETVQEEAKDTVLTYVNDKNKSTSVRW